MLAIFIILIIFSAFFSGLETALFEPMDFGSAALIKDAIGECLNKYEQKLKRTRLKINTY